MSGQIVATIGIAAIAIGILIARVYQVVRGSGEACGSCHSCAVSRGVTVTPLVQLGGDHSRKPEPSAGTDHGQTADSK